MPNSVESLQIWLFLLVPGFLMLQLVYPSLGVGLRWWVVLARSALMSTIYHGLVLAVATALGLSLLPYAKEMAMKPTEQGLGWGFLYLLIVPVLVGLALRGHCMLGPDRQH